MLKLFFGFTGLSPATAQFCDKLTRTCIDVYNTITTQLLPTPAKSHYTFNLRDLSKVFQGMLMAEPTKIDVSRSVYVLRKKIGHSETVMVGIW